MAAKMIKSAIKKHPNKMDVYPSSEDVEILPSDQVPELLLSFMKVFTNDQLKQNSIAQAIHACTKANIILPLHSVCR